MWAEAITRTLTDEKYARGLGHNGRTHALGFSWEEHADHLVGLYRRLRESEQERPHPADEAGSMLATLRDAGTVGLLHAHPDDESLATGALIADLVDHGATCKVLTATRGERGEVVDGPLSHLAGTEELNVHRVGELEAALAALGAEPPEFLDYEDSGMRWITDTVAGPAEDVSERALTSAPVEQVADAVVEWIRREGVDMLVTYDSTGGYGHPDHVHLHHAGVRAAMTAGVPLVEILPTRKGTRWLGEWTELPHTRERVLTALRAHASQLEVTEPVDGEGAQDEAGIVVRHSGGQEEVIPLLVGLRRHR